ncbi:TonB-dependent siderophore receptor [Luteimonas sp. R10]|uniref:TonB-dependent siderophore receptor n=1 Tax=Luteimonas sp. R10 TaxID=3108176 RepID=UPI00308A33D7|nr:TonB-dependent siderophore receptor [Luteimonas sp. R10]
MTLRLVPRAPRLALALLAAASAPVAAQSGAATDLDAIHVTGQRATVATKTDTDVTRTPQAVSVVTDAQIAARGALNLQETLRYTAGVIAEPYGLDTRGDGSAVRGMTSAQYLDGLRQIYNYDPIPRPDVYTFDRVEVLRGPSSVLYGAGGSGGVINAMSKRPQFTPPTGEVALQAGSHDRRQLMFDVTGTLDDGERVAGRLVGVARDSGMQTDVMRDDRVLVAPSVAFRPGEGTTVTLLGLHQRDRTGSSQQFLPVAATLRAPPGRRLDPSTFLGDPDYDRLDARQDALTLLVEHAFSDNVKLRSSSRYADIETTFQEIYPDVYTNPEDPFLDADDRVVDRFAYAVKPDIRVFNTDNSIETAFDTGTIRHRVLAGVDWSDFRESSLSGSGTVTPIDIYDPVSTGVVGPEYVRLPDQRNTQLGVYVQDQMRWADRVSILLGARRDRARSETQGAGAQVDYATTWRVGVIGEVAPGWSPYVSYAESFLPVPGADFYGVAFRPVRGRQYEAGVKWSPRGGVLVTANLYRLDETNRATNDPENVVNVVQTGKVEAEGVELEAAFVIGGVSVNANYTYNDARVTESGFAPELDKRLADVPRELASVWAMRGFDVGDSGRVRAGLGVRHVGDSLSHGAAGSLRTPSYTLADAMAGYETGAWSFMLNATNLADKTYYAPCRVFGDCFTGNGRYVVGTVAYRF